MDDDAFAELLNHLDSSGTARDERDRGVVSILRYDDVSIDPALRLHLTPSALGRRLQRTADDAARVFPDVEPDRAAWQLFLVHLDEAVRTAGDGRTELLLDRSGVRPVSPAEVACAPTEEDQERFGALVACLAEKGELVADHWRGPIIVLEYRGVPFDPPLRFEVSPRSLGEHVDATGREWPDVIAVADRALSAARPGQARLDLSDEAAPDTGSV